RILQRGDEFERKVAEQHVRRGLPDSAVRWLRRQRVPLFVFGPAGRQREVDLLAAQVPGMLASVVPETERPAVMPRCGESDPADSALLPTQVREPPGKRGAATRFKRQAARSEFVSATDLGGVLLSQQELVAVLHKRPEWEEHRHQGVAGARPGKLFTPKQQQAAQQYLELTPKGSRNAQSLRDHLLSKGLKSADLPTLEQFSVTVAPTVAALSDWPRSGETVDALYLLEGFVHVSEQRVFVAYTCRGMLATLRRYVGDVVHLAVDAKMKVLTGGMGVATLSLLVKDGLRNTNLCHQ
ncbi:unnamed protein product, partial [Effrenium voratum]